MDSGTISNVNFKTNLGDQLNIKPIFRLTGLAMLFALTGCSTGPNQSDIYACEDWASAYSFLESSETEDGELFVGILQLTADKYEDAAAEANDPELSELISQLSIFYSSASDFLADDNADLLVDVDAEDKDIYRKCLELGITTEITSDQIPDWYQG